MGSGEDHGDHYFFGCHSNSAETTAWDEQRSKHCLFDVVWRGIAQQFLWRRVWETNLLSESTQFGLYVSRLVEGGKGARNATYIFICAPSLKKRTNLPTFATQIKHVILHFSGTG